MCLKGLSINGPTTERTPAPEDGEHRFRHIFLHICSMLKNPIMAWVFRCVLPKPPSNNRLMTTTRGRPDLAVHGPPVS